MLKEEWKTIKVAGLENYKISNLGKISAKKREGANGKTYKAQMITNRDKTGRAVHLKEDGCSTPKSYQIGRLVAETYLGKPELSGMVINHIDGDLSNNRLDNVEWTTTDKLALKKMGNNIIGIRATRDGKNYDFDSLDECCKTLNLASSNVSSCLSDRKPNQVTHHGYSFKYLYKK